MPSPRRIAVPSEPRQSPRRETMRAPMTRRTVVPSRVALIAFMLVLLFPGLALAHLGLASSTPKEGAHLGVAPRELRLRFTEAVEASVARLRLLGPNGTEVAISAVRSLPDSGQVIIADITGALEAGTYTVEWQVIGRDGHPVRGTIPFVIAPGATGVGAAVTPSASDTMSTQHHDPTSMPTGEGFGAESIGYVIVRWLQFTALLLVIGTVAFAFVVLGLLRRTEPDTDTVSLMRTRAAAVGLWASVALLAVTFLRLMAQSFAMHGPGQAFSASFVGSMLTNTVWGWGWILQLIAVVLAIAAFILARREKSAGWALAAVACVALAMTPALSGHAASAPRYNGLAIASDTLHVIGAAGWLGSLLLLLAVGIPVAMRRAEGQRGATVARLVNAFSPTALGFAGLAVLTGVFSGWLHIGLSSALWQSDYGRTLLIKLAILSVVIATGAYNWLKVKPALGDDLGAQRIRRSATVEVAVGVLVLIVTAVLVATPPPMEEMTSGGDMVMDADSSGMVGMAGMDHSQMGAAAANASAPGADSGVGSMAGMDHSQMPMPAQSPAGSPATTTNGATGADASGSMAGMDHSMMQMGGTAAPAAGRARGIGTSAAGGMAGMDHSQMPMGTSRAPSAAGPAAAPRVTAQDRARADADEKLQRLIAGLVKDSVVRARIQADTALRRRWADTSLRRILTSPQQP